MEELSAIPQPHRGGENKKAAALPRRFPFRAWIRNVSSSTSLVVRRTVQGVIAHDCLNLAQSSAYSAIVALFPTLIVAAAVVSLIPDTAPLRFQLARFFDRILPSVVAPLLDAYFQKSPTNTHSLRALGGAAVVSFLGASNVVVTLMEGLRRARGLPANCWGFWQRRRRAFELVPLSIVPLSIASMLVVFGHAATMWIAGYLGAQIRPWFYAVALLIRWAVALGASVGLIALVYHLGTPERRIGVGRRQAVYVEEDGRQRSILLPGVVSGASGSAGGNGDVVCDDAWLWVVCNSFCELFRGVRVSGRGHRAAVLAVHHFPERAVRGGVQHAVPGALCGDETGGGGSCAGLSVAGWRHGRELVFRMTWAALVEPLAPCPYASRGESRPNTPFRTNGI